MSNETCSNRVKFKGFKAKNKSRFTELERQVSGDDIAKIVSKSTGIPVQKMVASEANKLKDLEKSLQERVVGQDHVLSLVSHAIRRSRSGLRNPNRPIASFFIFRTNRS